MYKQKHYERVKLYRARHPDRIVASRKHRWQRILNDPILHEKRKEYLRDSYKRHRLRYRAKAKENYSKNGRYNWKKINPEGYKQMRRQEYAKNKLNPFYRLNNAISSNIRHSLCSRKGGRHWESIFGYSLAQLIEHIEKQFSHGMSWDNYGAWHIDHIKPISHFNFSCAEDAEFRLCWSLNNLQPLWASENCSKQNRYVG